ncbi:unnamed protein product [Dicrocoelium dendriticum]|nr:unnamed protein product [Dicrocoelium dendriticum]
MVYFSVYQSPAEFEKEIRQKEKSWGISGNDALQIQYGHYGFKPISSFSKALLLSILGLGIVFQLFLAWSIKRGNLPTWLFETRSLTQSPADNRKSNADGLDASRSTTWREEHSDDRSDNSRYTGSNPFFWDPFSGFNTIKPVTTDVKFKVRITARFLASGCMS